MRRILYPFAFLMLLTFPAGYLLAQSGPTITGTNPTPAVEGQQVTITGSGFGGATGHVTFNPVSYIHVQQYSITSWSDSQIVTTVPVTYYVTAWTVVVVTSDGTQSA